MLYSERVIIRAVKFLKCKCVGLTKFAVFLPNFKGNLTNFTKL